MMDDIGGRLGRAMKESGVSARQLELRLREMGGPAVTRTTIGDYLVGKSSPSALVLLRIADALSLRAAWLLTGEGDQHQPPVSVVRYAAQPWFPPALLTGYIAATHSIVRQRVKRGLLPKIAVLPVDKGFIIGPGSWYSDKEKEILARNIAEGERLLLDYLTVAVRESFYAAGWDVRVQTLAEISAWSTQHELEASLRDALQFFLFAHEKLIKISSFANLSEQSAAYIASKSHSVRGKSVAKGHTKTGKDGKQPTKRRD